MNTQEARERLLAVSQEALLVVNRACDGEVLSASDRARVREILQEARVLAYDAGYPGELAWRAILRAGVYVNAPPADMDDTSWCDVAEDLREGIEQLSLVTGFAVE